jgi:hypothetical protein
LPFVWEVLLPLQPLLLAVQMLVLMERRLVWHSRGHCSQQLGQRQRW